MKAISKIHDEHRSLAAVLHGLKQLAHEAEDSPARPGFAAFRAMIRYIDEFPEKLHHPKEDDYLFARLVAPVFVDNRRSAISAGPDQAMSR